MAVKTYNTTDKNPVGAVNEVKATADSKLESVATDTTVGGDGKTGTELTTRFTQTAITTSDDGSDTLSTSTTPSVIVTGSGINHSINLGDATDYTLGHEFKILNSSDEFIHVFNSDETKVVHVPPRSTGVFICTDISSAAGVWRWWIADPTDGNISKDINNFYGVSTSSTDNGFSTSDTGVGSRSQVNTYRNGLLRLESGTDTNSGCCVYKTSRIYLNGEAVSFFAGCSVSDLSDGTDDYSVIAGLTTDNSPTAAPTDGIYFEYNLSTLSSAFWNITTANSSTYTRTATTVTPDTSQSISTQSNGDGLYFEIASDGSRVDFWINDAHVGSSTTNLPGSAFPHFSILKSAGTNERTLGISQYRLIQSFNSDRW